MPSSAARARETDSSRRRTAHPRRRSGGLDGSQSDPADAARLNLPRILRPSSELRNDDACPREGHVVSAQGEGSGPARSIPADVRAGEMHASVRFAPAPHAQLRGAGRRARPVRVLSARSGAGRRRVRTGGDAEDGDDEGRAGPDNGSRRFLVERRMPSDPQGDIPSYLSPTKGLGNGSHDVSPLSAGVYGRTFVG